MHKPILTAAAILGTALAVIGQTANCSGAPVAQTFSNRPDFGASFYYNIGSHLFDLNVQTPVSISAMRTWTYDTGTGNPPTPNQLGATGVVNVYTCPTTRLGNETLNPANPGSPWTLLGAGTITIADCPTNESQIVFAPPLAMPAGPFGVAVVYLPTTTGPNPGPLHCLGVSPNPGLPVSDQWLTFSNDAIQNPSWTGVGTASPNLRIVYTPAPNSAQYVASGDGCYFRPHAFYQTFPGSPSAPSLANTGLQMINLGPNYLVVPFASTIVPAISPSLTASPPGATSSANWDDALTAPITLPFAFAYPGGPPGGTTTITISSNGCVYLTGVTGATYEHCGAFYSTLPRWRDREPRLAPYWHDLDPDPITGGGTMHYDIDPANQFVRITWLNVWEWGPVPLPLALNTMQLTLYAGGNIEIAYGALANTGQEALAGFTPGNGARLAPPMNIIASLPFQTGDGAIPPVLTMDARPVLGTTPNVVTKNVTAGTIIELLAAGTAGLPLPIDLTFLGMPGCFLHMTPDVFLTAVVNPSNEFVVPFAIPNNPAFQNLALYFQAAPLTGGLNPLGIITSNGLCAKMSSL